MWEQKDSISKNGKESRDKSTWLVVTGVLLAIVIVVLVGMIYWRKDSANFLNTDAIFQQIDDLQGQVADLENKLSKKESAPQTDTRPVFIPTTTPKTDCVEKFNSDKANQKIIYSNATRGLSLDVPFNEKWGSDNYKIDAYNEIKRKESDGKEYDALIFGALQNGNKCIWARSYYLTFFPAKTVEETLTDVKKLSDLPIAPKQKELNDLTIIEYIRSGPTCEYPVTQVIGEKYNYKIEPDCGANIKELKELEDILKGLKLVK